MAGGGKKGEADEGNVLPPYVRSCADRDRRFQTNSIKVNACPWFVERKLILTPVAFKAIDFVQEHILKQGDQSNESAVEQFKDEQISDAIRSAYRSVTGHDVPVKDK